MKKDIGESLSTQLRETFTILESLSKYIPELGGCFSRSTGAVDTDEVVRILGARVQSGRDIENSILESHSPADFNSLRLTVEAIRCAEVLS